MCEHRHVNAPLPDHTSEASPLGGRILVASAVAAIGLFWVLAFVTRSTQGVPDELSDRTFPLAAEEICQPVRTQINTLPKAPGIDSPLERAVVVTTGTDLLQGMVDDLRAIAPDPTSSDEAGWIAEWLDDWDTIVADRRAFIVELEAGDENARYLSSDKTDGPGVESAVKVFADTNSMSSCTAPGDV